MALQTTSEVVSFARKLEEDGANYYVCLARLNPRYEYNFQLYAKENRNNIKQVQRVYYEVISDAIEGCFAFNMDVTRFLFEGLPDESSDLGNWVKRAIDIEIKTAEFYSEAAKECKSLMAGIPRIFSTIARKRDNRITELKALLSSNTE